MYTENKQMLHLISLLKQFGISKIVISPGSRHYPLTHSFEADSYFKLYSVVDERSAAFFALGLIQESGNPVAVCCSSGTSTVNFSSAICEAYYQKLPLLVITGDRLPALLGQTEDQMIKQDDVYQNFINYHCQLPMNDNDIDIWHSNRMINEALIELTRREEGPVHINIPIKVHRTDTFQTKSLPAVRRIFHHSLETEHSEWNELSSFLSNKKVLIIWGQSLAVTPEFEETLNQLSQLHNFVILADRIANCHHQRAIGNTFTALRSMSIGDQTNLAPDIVISVGENFVFNLEVKGFLGAYEFKNWQINKGGTIKDPFKRLNRLFEMTPQHFFKKIVEYSEKSENTESYFNDWNAISQKVVEPDVEYSQLQVIGKLVKSIPQNSVLQIANSNAIRFVHLFDFHKSIECHCNRGVNGIDGCMSTAVGYAASSSKPVFFITGDLTFFYDMNAVWNRHLSKNLRILVVNNEGGAVMHMPFGTDKAKELEQFTSAGHQTSVKGWVESVGFTYVGVKKEDEVDNAIEMLTNTEYEGPVLVEVFTKKEEDVQTVKEFYSQINTVTTFDRAKRKIVRIAKQYLKN